jgi:S1-C subfamily serine protease
MTLFQAPCTQRAASGQHSGREGIVIAGAVSLAAFLYVASARAGELRTWSSADGAYTTDAELIELKDGAMVILKKKDGGVIQVPLTRLSSADQAYVRSQSATAGSFGTDRAADSRPARSPEEVEAEALQTRTAKEAVLVYKFYLAEPNLSASQRSEAEAELKSWEQKAAEDLVRLGDEWMPLKEADEFRKQADAKIENALELLRLQNGELARLKLEEASRLDPDSIKADFLMGVVYGTIAGNDRKAQLHFEKCLRREPGNVSVLNNLAVSLTFQKKYREAVEHWKTAAAAAPKMKALTQNIGSLIAMSGTRRARVPSRTLQDLSEVYEELVSTHGNPRPANVGFVYTPPYGSGWNAKQGAGDGKAESVIVSSGSGFVVHPHIILTNQHVVEGASGLLVLDPKKPKSDPLAAELIAVSTELDLALIRCPGLDAPPVRLVEKLPPRGTDIMVLGYPLGPSFGTTLKSTRGAMVAMPDSSVENMFLFDAITNPGNSGGPLCDKTGRVAGVVRAVTGSIGGSYGAGIPISDAIPFIRKFVPDLAVSTAAGEEVDWPAVDALVSPSTVLILTKEELQSDEGFGKRRSG